MYLLGFESFVFIQAFQNLMQQLLTGKRPGKRAMELIRFYMMGYAELDEVIVLLAPKKTVV